MNFFSHLGLTAVIALGITSGPAWAQYATTNGKEIGSGQHGEGTTADANTMASIKQQAAAQKAEAAREAAARAAAANKAH